MTSTRREFVMGGLAAGASLPIVAGRLAPAWLQAAGSMLAGRKLVVLQVHGGWDYFNQIVPVNMPVYYSARPTTSIGIADSEGVSTLTIAAGIPQKWAIALQPFKAMYDAGRLAVINNIGYPRPNLSHFSSEMIWEEADPNASIRTQGWLSRYLTKGYAGGYHIPALDIETRLNGSFLGSRVPVMRNTTTFSFQFDASTAADNNLEAQLLMEHALALRATQSPNLQFLCKGLAGSVNDSATLLSTGAGYTPRVTYPNSQLARDLQLVARYITGGLPTHVYYLGTGGFDNHANLAIAGQAHTGTLANLLNGVSGSVKAFLDDMAAWGVANDVVVVIFSEFSRRFGANGSIGTDHGHGGVAYVAGAPVKGGFYGTFPDLSKATTPYANYYPPFDATSTDFRSLYATVLERWLGVASTPILGAQFPLLGCL
jgi:uncharacterized protein (DUF1501 family)